MKDKIQITNKNTKYKQTKGWITDGKHFGLCPVDVRVTNDEKGKSLSLTVREIQIGIGLEGVEDLIKLAEEDDGK